MVLFMIGIDFDLVVYRAAFGAQSSKDGEVLVQPVTHAIYNCKKIIGSICTALKCVDIIGYLTASNDLTNYRLYYGKEYASGPTRPKGYKAHRAAIPKPIHYQACRDYLMKTYICDLAIGEEADDRLGIDMCKGRIQIIASLDKDLDMIPGRHFNWVKYNTQKKETLEDLSAIWGTSESMPGIIDRLNSGLVATPGEYIIDELTGLRNFYKQFLIGDSADNIRGVQGIGPVKASALIDPLHTESDMIETIRSYLTDEQDVINIGRCLWIRRQEGEMWLPGH